MRKNFKFIASAALAFLFFAVVACQNSGDAVDEFVKFLNKTTEKVKNAKSEQQLNEILELEDAGVEAIIAKNGSVRLTLEQKEDISVALSDFLSSCFEKGAEFGGFNDDPEIQRLISAVKDRLNSLVHTRVLQCENLNEIGSEIESLGNNIDAIIYDVISDFTE